MEISHNFLDSNGLYPPSKYIFSIWESEITLKMFYAKKVAVMAWNSISSSRTTINSGIYSTTEHHELKVDPLKSKQSAKDWEK